MIGSLKVNLKSEIGLLGLSVRVGGNVCLTMEYTSISVRGVGLACISREGWGTCRGDAMDFVRENPHIAKELLGSVVELVRL